MTAHRQHTPLAIGDPKAVRSYVERPDGYIHAGRQLDALKMVKIEDAEKAIHEMARLVKPGGALAIGEVSDLAKKDEAMAIRAQSHKDQPKLSKDDLDHLYLPKSLFEKAGRELGFDVTVVDHTTLKLPSYQAARYRYTAYMRGAKS